MQKIHLDRVLFGSVWIPDSRAAPRVFGVHFFWGSRVERFARVVESDLILSATLKPIEWRVWIALKLWAGPDGRSWPSVAQIAKAIGSSAGRVAVGIHGLKMRGLIERRGHVIFAKIPQDETIGIRQSDYRNPVVSEVEPDYRNPIVELPESDSRELPDSDSPTIGIRETNRPKNKPVNRPKNKPDLKSDPEVQALFEIWKSVTGKTERAKLDGKRSASLAEGIKRHGLVDAEGVIRGMGLSDWHMGRDPRGNGKTYCEPHNAFRTAGHSEGFLEAWTLHQKPRVPRIQDVSDRWMAHFENALQAISGDHAGTEEIPRGGIPRHPDDYALWFASDNAVASAEAGRRLISELGVDFRDYARNKYREALGEYRREVKQRKQKHVEDNDGSDSGRDSEGGELFSCAEDGEGIFGDAHH